MRTYEINRLQAPISRTLYVHDDGRVVEEIPGHDFPEGYLPASHVIGGIEREVVADTGRARRWRPLAGKPGEQYAGAWHSTLKAAVEELEYLTRAQYLADTRCPISARPDRTPVAGPYDEPIGPEPRPPFVDPIRDWTDEEIAARRELLAELTTSRARMRLKRFGGSGNLSVQLADLDQADRDAAETDERLAAEQARRNGERLAAASLDELQAIAEPVDPDEPVMRPGDTVQVTGIGGNMPSGELIELGDDWAQVKMYGCVEVVPRDCLRLFPDEIERRQIARELLDERFDA